MERIGRYYDIEFDQVIVNPEKHNSEMSILQLSETGIHFLLGKNGAGKSRLIKSLGAFNDGSDSAFRVSLIGQLPSDRKLEELRIAIDEFVPRPFAPFPLADSPDEQKYFYGNPPFLNCVIESFWGCQRRYQDPFVLYSEKAILEHFNFPREDIDRWEKYFRSNLERQVDDGLHSTHKPNYLKDSYSLSDHKCQIFLAWLSSSIINYRGQYHDPADIQTDSTKWVESDDHIDLFLKAFCEFIDSVTHIEFSERDDRSVRGFRLLASLPTKGRVAELIATREEEIKFQKEFLEANPDKWYDESGIQIALRFPFDLFLTSQLPAGKFARSIAIPLREDFFEDGTLANYQLLDFHDPDKDLSHDLEKSLKKYLGENHMIKTDLENSNDMVRFELNGFDKNAAFLKKLSKFVSRVDIGVSQIIEQRPKIGHGYTAESIKIDDMDTLYPISDLEHLKPKLLLFDHKSNQKFRLADASSGQKDVIRTLFWLLSIETEDCLIAVATLDEFDRHLQSAAAERLLYQINEISKEKNLRTVVSTHRIPQFSSPLIRQCPRIFSHKNIHNQPVFTAPDGIPPEELIELLGVHANEVLNLKKLRILVEGKHDAMIIKHLIKSSPAIQIDDVEFVVANGTYAFAGLWKYKFANDEIPVMIVHDKKSNEVELAFNKAKEIAKKQGIEDKIWKESGLLAIDLGLRKKLKNAQETGKRKNQGDVELRSLVWLIKEILAHKHSRENGENWNTCTDLNSLQKVEIVGLNCSDIVDLLPIEAFPKAKSYGNWEKARKDIGETDGNEFKSKLGINEASIEEALKTVKSDWPEELTRLANAISRYGSSLSNPPTA